MHYRYPYVGYVHTWKERGRIDEKNNQLQPSFLFPIAAGQDNLVNISNIAIEMSTNIPCNDSR